MKNFFTILLVCLAAYFPVLGKKAVNPDAHLIVPGLMTIKNPWEYFQMVASFNTIDFQPTRDLTFFFDLFIFRNLGIVSFATTNVLIWAIAGFFLLKILLRIIPAERRQGAIFWVILFLVWPLFTQAVPWGMARKHILAFMLILIATDFYFDWMEGKKSWLSSFIAYVLAALSHPLVLLWPIWAFLHSRIHFPNADKELRKKFFIFSITMVVILLTNYAYYTIGNEVVAENFWKLKPDYFDIKSQLFRLAFSFRQIAFPFQFGFLYWPDFSIAWPGFLVISGLAFLVWRNRKNTSIYSWLFFTAMSFPITLTLENFFDQYLIIPATGLFILVFTLFHKPSKKISIFLTLLSLGFAGFTLTQVTLWTNQTKFTERNFHHYPTCKNASNYANKIYDDASKAPLELLQFLEQNNCIVINPLYPAGVFRNNIYLLSRMMFYESERFSREDRYSKLRELGKLYYYPQLIYASLLAEDDQAESVEEACKFILKATGGNKVDTGALIQKHLRPYCERKRLPACLKLTEYTEPAPKAY